MHPLMLPLAPKGRWAASLDLESLVSLGSQPEAIPKGARPKTAPADCPRDRPALTCLAPAEWWLSAPLGKETAETGLYVSCALAPRRADPRVPWTLDRLVPTRPVRCPDLSAQDLAGGEAWEVRTGSQWTGGT